MLKKMKAARELFETHERGILEIIRAADIYALHLLAKFRNGPPPQNETIASIMDGAVSVMNFTAFTFTEPERILLIKDGHLRAIGQQILVSSYTAIELYLTNKFFEYYRHTLAGLSQQFIDASISHLYLRSLKDISKAFFAFYSIHLPSFDFELFTGDGSNFCPSSAWNALNLLSKARNEIVHGGESKSYVINMLVDSWYPFDFTRYYVNYFDDNFDNFIYHNKTTTLVLEHQKRRQSGVASPP